MQNGDQKTQMSMGLNFDDVESEVDEAYDVEINQTNNNSLLKDWINNVLYCWTSISNLLRDPRYTPHGV